MKMVRTVCNAAPKGASMQETSSRPKPRSRRVFARPFTLACIGLALTGSAAAQRAVVLTQAVSAVRDAGRLYASSVDFGYGAVLPGPVPLPGNQLTGPLLVRPDGHAVAAGSRHGPGTTPGPPAAPGTFLTAIQTNPFQALGSHWLTERNQSLQPGGTMAGVDGKPHIILLEAPDGEASEGEGIVRLVRWTEKKPGVTTRRWEVPGRPVAAAAFAGNRLAVLYSGGEGPGLAVLTLNEEQPIATVPLMPHRRETGVHAEPASLAAGPEGEFIFALLSGFDLDRPAGGPVSWLMAVDVRAAATPLPPIRLKGRAAPDTASMQATAGGCWAATRVPGSGFGYVTRGTLMPETPPRLEKTAEEALAGLSQPLHMTPEPRGKGLAVAIDDVLEYWPEGRRRQARHRYDAVVAALQWDEEGLFVAEGGRLHRVVPETARPKATVQFQSGWIRDFAVIPERAIPPKDRDGDGLGPTREAAKHTAPANPDTDGDGIHDGIDPEPTTPSPRLMLPPTLVFRGSAAGREIRAMMVDPGSTFPARWSIAHDADALPWLRLFPTSGEGARAVYLGVDPHWYRPGINDRGQITVRMEGRRPGRPAAGSPATVHVAVEPAEAKLDRILWVWGAASDVSFRAPSDPRGLARLARRLAGPPHYFAHEEASGPVPGSLKRYTVVVLTAEAAAQGVLTQQALLDFVAGGGGLLVLGQQQVDDAAPMLLDWLRPLGFQVEPKTGVEGRFAAAADHPLTEHWAAPSIRRGRSFGRMSPIGWCRQPRLPARRYWPHGNMPMAALRCSLRRVPCHPKRSKAARNSVSPQTFSAGWQRPG